MTAGLETFAKVRALHDSTANPGEKASAALRMHTLARKAGMSVEQAVSKLDAPKPETPAQAAVSAFNDFFNRPEARAARAEQDRQRAVRRTEILARYGSVVAVYAETEREAALRLACTPMTVWDRRPDWEGNYTLDGWGPLNAREKVPPRVREAVTEAWPLPRTVGEAWAEYIAAEEHERDRQTMHDGEHFPALWADVRRYVVEDLLDTLPAASIEDMLLRQSWLEHLNDQGFSRDVRQDAVLLATLRADIERVGERLREAEAEAVAVQSGQGDGFRDFSVKPCSPNPGTSTAPVHSGHRRPTRAERHEAIRALLAENLTDREVARRLGISPTTVGTVRRST